MLFLASGTQSTLVLPFPVNSIHAEPLRSLIMISLALSLDKCCVPIHTDILLPFFSTTRIESEFPINFCPLLKSTVNTTLQVLVSMGKLWKDVTVLAGYSPSLFFFFFFLNCSYHTVQRTWEDWLSESYETYETLGRTAQVPYDFRSFQAHFYYSVIYTLHLKFHLELRGRSQGSFSLSFLPRFFLTD